MRLTNKFRAGMRYFLILSDHSKDRSQVIAANDEGSASAGANTMNGLHPLVRALRARSRAERPRKILAAALGDGTDSHLRAHRVRLSAEFGWSRRFMVTASLLLGVGCEELKTYRFVHADIRMNALVPLDAISEDDECTEEASIEAARRQAQDLSLILPEEDSAGQRWDICGGAVVRSQPQPLDICGCAASYWGLGWLLYGSFPISGGPYVYNNELGMLWAHARAENVIVTEGTSAEYRLVDLVRTGLHFCSPEDSCPGLLGRTYLLIGPRANQFEECQLPLESRPEECMRRLWVAWDCRDMRAYDPDECPDVDAVDMMQRLGSALGRVYGERGLTQMSLTSFDITVEERWRQSGCSLVVDAPNIEYIREYCE